MKAIVYTEYGTPDVLRIEEVKRPVPKDNEVLIRIVAAEATKADCEMRSFQFAVQWFWLPLRIAVGITRPRNSILGAYFSGIVEATGEKVDTLKVGERVYGSARLRMGAYGEYACLPAHFTIVPMPDNLSFEEAAAVPLGGLNALHFMRKANIRAGEKVLINGAGGSIGLFAVQIAKSLGAEVTAVDSGIKEQMLKSIGVDHFIDYTKEDLAQHDQTYDVIFNMVAGSPYSSCIGRLNPNGRYLMGNPRLSDMLRSVLTTRFTNKDARFAFAGEKREELLELKEMIETGTIRPVVDTIYSMEHAAEAHRRVETEQRLGSVVISLE